MPNAHLSPPQDHKPPKYPWDQWLNGDEWTIMRGRDYWGDSQEMAQKVRRAAGRRKLRVQIEYNSGFLTMRAVPREGVA